MAIAIVVLLGMASLAVDTGYWRYQQRLEQSAADSGAIAGATELAFPAAAEVTAAARADAAANGYADGVSNVTVTVNNPPASGSYSGSSDAVEVVVEKRQPVFFAGIFGLSQSVRVRAVAAKSSAGRTCIYALNGDITLHGGGGGGIEAPTCGILTNVNLNVTGQANVDASSIGYVGDGPGGGSYPQAQPQKAVAVADPCPTIPGCAYLAAHPPAAGTCMPQSPPPDPLPPGEYCSAFDLGSVSTFAGGLYVFDQGMSASGNATISGTNVTIYNKGGVTLSGKVSVDFRAPTTGTMAGMVYYQPPTDTQAFTVNGKAGTDNFVGGMYLPTADLTLNGNVPAVTLLVVNSITMNGGGIGATSAGLPGVGHVVLAE